MLVKQCAYELLSKAKNNGTWRCWHYADLKVTGKQGVDSNDCPWQRTIQSYRVVIWSGRLEKARDGLGYGERCVPGERRRIFPLKRWVERS